MHSPLIGVQMQNLVLAYELYEYYFFTDTRHFSTYAYAWLIFGVAIHEPSIFGRISRFLPRDAMLAR